MYITLTDLRQGALPRCLKNQEGRLEIALCEITYYANWYNISADLQNNVIVFDGTIITITGGYYNVCDLNEHVFKPHGAKLDLHAPSGFLRITSNASRIQLRNNLMRTLGFTVQTIEPGGILLGSKHPQLAIHKKLNIHLLQLSTFQNSYNGIPSTLLRSVPVKNETCGGGRTVAFPVLQYKRLMTGDIPQLTVFVMDEHEQKINLEYISIILYIKDG